MKNIKKFVLICLVFSPLYSMAWGALGHRIVGEIAESHLNNKAKKAVAKILGNESMAIASNWPDFIKANPYYKNFSSWHYINFKNGLTKPEFEFLLSADTDQDAFTAINFLVSKLKENKIADSLKTQYLKLLIHIVGDIHQPLHVGRQEDLGGNKIMVKWFDKETNLHSVWDGKLVNFQQLSYTEYARSINFHSKEYKSKIQNSSVSEWLYESYLISGEIYAKVKPNEKLGYNYNYNNIDIINKQLLKSGIRLAGLLNDIFG